MVINKKINFGWSHFKKPTPKVMKRLGLALIAASLFVVSSPLYLELSPAIAWIGFGCGLSGALITTFFSENK